MVRFAGLVLAVACVSFVGCSGSDKTDKTDVKTENVGKEVENDLQDAGMEGISTEEYLQGGKKTGN